MGFGSNYIELSPEFVNKHKAEIDGFTQSLFGIEYETKTIICEVLSEYEMEYESVKRKCYAIPKKGKLPVNLNLVSRQIVDRGTMGWAKIKNEPAISEEELKEEYMKQIMKKQLSSL